LQYSRAELQRELNKREEAKRLAIAKEARRRGLITLDTFLGSIKPEIVRNCPDNMFDFVEGLRKKGLRVDNFPFRWEGFEYLEEIYRNIRFTGQSNEEGLSLTLMCGAQVAKSVTAFLSCTHMPLFFWGRYFGYYLPNEKMANDFSAERYKPMVRGIAEIKPLWGNDPTSDDNEKQTDKKGVRTIGPSKIIFSYMGGSTSTEGWPLLGVCFDEVRRMLDKDIELVRERMSHSAYPIEMLFSTAGFPDINIDLAFKQSNQNKFHTRCGCKDGVILSEVFPQCIAENTGIGPAMKKLPKYFYCCPICKTIILNPRDGHWRMHNPASKKMGYHIPQTLSCAQTAGKIIEAFRNAKNVQEFYNSKLGVSYLPKDAMIVTEAILRATVNKDLKWLKTGRNFAMGIDQMGNFNVVTIRCWGEKSDLGAYKSRLVHLEMIYSEDPWERCTELMQQYDIAVCVADAAPNFNEARRFAKKREHVGRVFLCEYNYTPEKGDDDICEWGDRPKKTVSQRKSSEETINKYRVRANRYLAIEWNLKKFVERLKEQPDERTLDATWQNDLGKPVNGPICQDVYWVHLQKIARVMETDEETGEIKMNFVNLGLDPHFLHADLYCELALSRINPDQKGKAFGDYGERVRSKVKKGEHDWQQQGATPIYTCSECGLAVRIKGDQTPQQAAEKAGFKKCEPKQA